MVSLSCPPPPPPFPSSLSSSFHPSPFSPSPYAPKQEPLQVTPKTPSRKQNREKACRNPLIAEVTGRHERGEASRQRKEYFQTTFLIPFLFSLRLPLGSLGPLWLGLVVWFSVSIFHLVHIVLLLVLIYLQLYIHNSVKYLHHLFFS